MTISELGITRPSGPSSSSEPTARPATRTRAWLGVLGLGAGAVWLGYVGLRALVAAGDLSGALAQLVQPFRVHAATDGSS